MITTESLRGDWIAVREQKQDDCNDGIGGREWWVVVEIKCMDSAFTMD